MSLRKIVCLLSIALLVCEGLFSQTVKEETIDLSGNWRFNMDPQNIGEKDRWFTLKLPQTVMLPGSMATNNKGNDVGIHTQWTGSIFDSSWYFKPAYANYRQPGNIKMPFWLQPVKYYTGAAWYQRTITIPHSWQQKVIELHIERSHWETTVWLNDRLIGVQNSLSTEQVFHLSGLKPGKHELTIRVDNQIKQINVGPNSHSISDHTQTNWNGMVGNLFLAAKPQVFIEQVSLYPDIQKKQVKAKIKLRNFSGKSVEASLSMLAVSTDAKAEKLKMLQQSVTVDADSSFVEAIYPMGNNPLLWDEFSPNMYTLEVALQSKLFNSKKHLQFGMRKFEAKGTSFAINDRITFLRGTLECAIFPLTGYPPTDTAAWLRIFRIVKKYGLNHVRFHSWCPPEAAFVAADKLGVYLQVESASWANWGTTLGDGKPIDAYLYDESTRIMNAYGNHPSFCLFTYGNEPSGDNQNTYLNAFVNYWKKKDARRVYTSGAGWPVIESNDYNSISDPRIQRWGEELNSIINKNKPATDYDFSKIISQYTIPTVSHEIGQWCVYPDFKEIKKYTGVLKPKNFEIFQTLLRKQGLGHLADSFLLASGKLQALCYKADIEAALRTKGMAGFQLLDLHDFPGQGTALVGVLNPFWEEKGYIDAAAYSAFCNSTVPLVRFPKMIYQNNEELLLPVEVAHFGSSDLLQITPVWEMRDADNRTLFKGTLAKTNITVGNGLQLGIIKQSLISIEQASKLTLTVTVGKYKNSWEFFVYPAIQEPIASNVFITQEFNETTRNKLYAGENVLVTLKKGSLRSEVGGTIKVGFSSIFWNTVWTNGQAPHTLGILVNPRHPALRMFPTDYYSSWQWWDAMTHSNAILLDSVSKGLKPIVRVIDDWVTANSLGLVFECNVAKGKLIVSSIDLVTDIDNRPEAKQLRNSLCNYMTSKAFVPEQRVQWRQLQKLVQ